MIVLRQPLIALLSVALVAFDAGLGALGHWHGDPLDSHSHQVACHHGAGDCDHDDHSPPADSAPAPHDDCSLCRHFGQQVVIVAVTVELIGSQRVEAIASVLMPRIAAVSKLPHPARGPPGLSA